MAPPQEQANQLLRRLTGVMRKLQMIRCFGPRWVLWRTWYAFRLKSGLLKRRFPPVDQKRVRLSDLVLSGTPTDPHQYRAFRESSPARFFFPPGKPPLAELIDVAGPEGKRRTISVADDYCRRRFLYYSRHVHDLGRPPDWLLNPFSGGRHDARRHWCDTPTFSLALGDIKDVWEPSRFACAFWLVRAYALTGDEKYPSAFWDLFESWCEQNPPNMGPNWKCGQETALRTMAWCFALFGFWNSPATRADRVVNMVKMIAIQADRIAGNIAYAVSQKNNHSLSEAVGLVTTALLFPELKCAGSWLALGRRVLEQDVPRQIYEDGSYVQHSMNYHRVMLHDCIWAIRLAELNDAPLSKSLIDRVARAGEFLFEMLDTTSGRVPNYGANDGALVLPLAACDYLDYRPTVQAARYQATGRRVLEPGPWDEMLVWLFGADGLAGSRADAVPTSRRFDAGGYYTLRAPDSWCMVRCHSYRDRPSHVDPLHVDLWNNGVNVLRDSGTYRYFLPGDANLECYFKDLRAHNSIEVDGRGPLELVSRFLWLPWPKARCLQHDHHRWVGEHYGYLRHPWRTAHRRTVQFGDGPMWVVRDELLGSGRHAFRLWWHLPDGPVRLSQHPCQVEVELHGGSIKLSVQGPQALRVQVHRGLRAGEYLAGWVSNYYGECASGTTMEVSGSCLFPTALTTEIYLGQGGCVPPTSAPGIA